MKNKLITVNEEIYLDSRQVAEMVGKRHADLLRDIDKFVDVLENAKMRSLDFFAKSTYTVEGNNKVYPCLVTNENMDLVEIVNDKIVVSSRQVAEKFEKEHYSIVRLLTSKLTGANKDSAS